jgi:KipI family sensor histidine kinase inhibitor
VARQASLSPAEVIGAHSGVDFDVYMMGFMPGFPYMASMPEALRVPRLTEPRVRVPIRSVSIAAEITVVYAIETPGGLSLIGRTPVPFFDLRRSPPVLLESGDQVRFEPISLADYRALERDYARHAKTLEFTWIDN